MSQNFKSRLLKALARDVAGPGATLDEIRVEYFSDPMAGFLATVFYRLAGKPGTSIAFVRCDILKLEHEDD